MPQSSESAHFEDVAHDRTDCREPGKDYEECRVFHVKTASRGLQKLCDWLILCSGFQGSSNFFATLSDANLAHVTL